MPPAQVAEDLAQARLQPPVGELVAELAIHPGVHFVSPDDEPSGRAAVLRGPSLARNHEMGFGELWVIESR